MDRAAPPTATAELIRALGGPSRIAGRFGVTTSAVSQWSQRGIPREHHLGMWRLALEAGLLWEPPGADAIRAQLAAPPARTDAA